MPLESEDALCELQDHEATSVLLCVFVHTNHTAIRSLELQDFSTVDRWYTIVTFIQKVMASCYMYSVPISPH
jgi:hypothetical protein